MLALKFTILKHWALLGKGVHCHVMFYNMHFSWNIVLTILSKNLVTANHIL